MTLCNETARRGCVECLVQAIVVGLLAAVTGLLLGWAMTAKLEAEHGLLLCASSVVTASLASLALGLVMVIVILASRACSVDPDNVATPIAASLGDLTTLGLLAWIGNNHLLTKRMNKSKF